MSYHRAAREHHNRRPLPSHHPRRHPPRRKRPKRLSIRAYILIILIIIASLVLFFYNILGVDTETEEQLGYAATLNVSSLNTNFDNTQLIYRFYYTHMPLELARHIIIDPFNLAKLITFSPLENTLTIYTVSPVIIDITYDYENNNINITLYNPRELYSHIVIIDPGHGGHDPGAVVGPTTESEIVLSISLKLYNILGESDNNIKAYMTRHNDIFVSFEERADFANSIGDIFISLHANYFDGAGSHLVYGTEVLFNPENPHKTNTSNRFDIDNATLAQIFQDNLVYELQTRDRGILEHTGLAVLNLVNIPASFLEIEFMTNQASLANLTNPSFQLRAAEALYRSIITAFNYSYNDTSE